MYTPGHFAEMRTDVLHQFIREHPLAALIDTTLNASHVPMLLDPEGRTLRCHVARANPQSRVLAEQPAVLAIFSGPEHYVSPAWYTAHPAVPTWNYSAVHVSGKARTFEGHALISHLHRLTAEHDTAWRIEDAPPSYIESLTRAIVGIEIEVERIEGKFKMSQNRSSADRDGVLTGLENLGTHRALELRDFMVSTG